MGTWKLSHFCCIPDRPHELMINNTHVSANSIPDTRYTPILVKEIGNAKNQIPIQVYPF